MKSGIFGGLGLIIVGAIALVAYFAVFIVDPTQQALVLRFGQLVGDPVEEPGLHFKVPLVDNVEFIERRILDLNSPPLEVIASDQKRLVVDAFGRYRIVDPVLFYQTVGSQNVADARLSVVLNSAVRRVLGDATFIDVVRDARNRLMTLITEQVNREAQRLGIEIVDIKIRRADLPEANSQAIYQRMQTERQREATEIRATGEQAARRIRAQADRGATVIVAEANKESEEIRGDGDAARGRIFADAFTRDPEFFSFYRSMQAYQQSLQDAGTRMILKPDSPFFRYLTDPSGGAPLAASAAPARNAPPAGEAPGAGAADGASAGEPSSSDDAAAAPDADAEAAQGDDAASAPGGSAAPPAGAAPATPPAAETGAAPAQ